MSSHTLRELAGLVGGEFSGDENLMIKGLNSIELAEETEITFITQANMLESLLQSRAAACIVPMDMETALKMAVIRTRHPDVAAAIIHNHFLTRPFEAKGINSKAHVGENCTISKNVSIGPMVCIGDSVTIGERVVFHPGVVVGADSVISDDTVLHANVTIADKTIIGKRVIIHSGAVIGSDGFGFATDPANGIHVKRPQVGNVRIDDDVEIGANTCIDRAAFGTTWIQSGVKIDNLVQIAHNVVVGSGSILVSQVGIAGSTTLGRHVVLGGATAVAGHLHLDDGVMAAARSGVHNNQPKGAIIGGAPAFEIKKWAKSTAAYARLPDMVKDLRRLRKEVDRLSSSLLKDCKEENREE